ncbi:hypothetical protein [Paraburkholderia terrae]|nr:hypothetical protein [Paraburkholderia terrae]
MASYHSIQKERFVSAQRNGIRVLELIAHFQRCSTPLAGRHALTRRKSELHGLVRFFTEIGNPAIDSIPELRQFEYWSLRHNDVRNLDSVRLFRNIWAFFVKRHYMEFPCPWMAAGQYHERVILELVDILYPYSDGPLREVLQAARQFSFDGATLPDIKTQKKELRDALRRASELACVDLKQSFRNDLIPALQSLTCDMLQEVVLSVTRVKNLPAGKINLTDQKRHIVASARQRVPANDSSTRPDT